MLRTRRLQNRSDRQKLPDRYIFRRGFWPVVRAWKVGKAVLRQRFVVLLAALCALAPNLRAQDDQEPLSEFEQVELTEDAVEIVEGVEEEIVTADDEVVVEEAPEEVPMVDPDAVVGGDAEPAVDAWSEMAEDFESRLKAIELSLEKKKAEPKDEKPKEKKWYEKLAIRGYAQFRYNPILADYGDAPPQHVGDFSVRDDQTFFIRRARLILYGDVSDHLYLYFQPDFAVTPPGSTDAINFAQIRDLYGDIYIDDDKEYRVRLGQSKIPYGWENLQSSQNRLPFDRADGLNSDVRNERDLAAIFYWTPKWAQDRFKYLIDEGLKGSGNYGVFGIGPSVGQGGSLRELNDNVHLVTRLTLPMQLDNGQLFEASVQGYMGEFVVPSSPISPLGVGPAVRPSGTLEEGDTTGHLDRRIAGTFVWYAQPWGFQSEWNVGRGPSLNNAQTAVIDRSLYGGYAMTMYRIQTEDCGEFWPFMRWSYYKGGYKQERNAPYSHINEWELGLEWQINKNVEFTSIYTITDRTNTTALGTANTRSYQQFEGQLLRLQCQLSY